MTGLDQWGATPQSEDLSRWKAARWTALAVDVGAVGISLVANIAEADPTGIARTVAAAPPLALFGLIVLWEIMPKVDGPAGRVFNLTLVLIAAICAFESAGHIADVSSEPDDPWFRRYALAVVIDGTAIAAAAAVVTANHEIRQLGIAERNHLRDQAEADAAAERERRAAEERAEAEAKEARRVARAEAASRPKQVPGRSNKDRAHQMRADGKSDPEIAEALGVSTRQVRRYFAASKAGAGIENENDIDQGTGDAVSVMNGANQ